MPAPACRSVGDAAYSSPSSRSKVKRAARQLQRRGFDVTIYAMTVPPDTTSNMSLAGFTPTTALINKDCRTPAWDAQFLRTADISYRQLQLMVGPTYGVYWMDAYNATNDPAGGGRGGGG